MKPITPIKNSSLRGQGVVSLPLNRGISAPLRQTMRSSSCFVSVRRSAEPSQPWEGWRSRRFDLLSKAENTILHANFTLFTRKRACIFLSWIPKPILIDIDQRSVPQENCLFRKLGVKDSLFLT